MCSRRTEILSHAAIETVVGCPVPVGAHRLALFAWAERRPAHARSGVVWGGLTLQNLLDPAGGRS